MLDVYSKFLNVTTLRKANRVSRDNIASQYNAYENAVDTIRVLPYSVPADNVNMTATNCINRCALYGYNAAGIEVGTQCCT